MKSKFVQCEYCKTEIPSESCALAALITTIDGKKYTFCCSKCAERREKSHKEQR
jgi:YHS domain-containing protein